MNNKKMDMHINNKMFVNNNEVFVDNNNKTTPTPKKKNRR